MRQVTIVGAGALGSHIVLFGRNWPEVSLQVIDFDRVETKNVESQFHTRMGIAKNKVVALQAALRGMFGKTISTIPHKLSADNVSVLLQQQDLVIDCTDNFEARKIAQTYCSSNSVPCLHCCLSAAGDLARLVWTEHFRPDKEDMLGEATCEDGRNLPFHALASAMAAQLSQLYLENGVKQSWQLTPYSMIRLI